MNLALVAAGTSSTSLKTLEDSARALARRIAQHSQECMCADWLDDIEFMLWQDLSDRQLEPDLLVSPSGTIFPLLDETEKDELRCMSRAIGGWVEWDSSDPADCAAYVPLEIWNPRFEAWLETVRCSLAESTRSGHPV